MLICLLCVASSSVLSADYPALSASGESGRHGGEFGPAVVLSRLVSGLTWEPGLTAPFDPESGSMAPARFEPDTGYFMRAVRAPSDIDYSTQVVEIDRARKYFIRVPSQFESGILDLGRIFRRNPGQE